MALRFRDDVQIESVEQDYAARRQWLLLQRADIEARTRRSGFTTPGDSQRQEQIAWLLSRLEQQHKRDMNRCRNDWRAYQRVVSG